MISFVHLVWPVDLVRVENFLCAVDTGRLLPLSKRVSVPAYAAKILKQGVILMAVGDSNQECGMVAFYCNDLIRREGFITYMAVLPDHRGRGLGRKLLEQALAVMSARGMEHVRLEVNTKNLIAKKLYTNCGFLEFEKTPPNEGSENVLMRRAIGAE